MSGDAGKARKRKLELRCTIPTFTKSLGQAKLKAIGFVSLKSRQEIPLKIGPNDTTRYKRQG